MYTRAVVTSGGRIKTDREINVLAGSGGKGVFSETFWDGDMRSVRGRGRLVGPQKLRQYIVKAEPLPVLQNEV